MSNKTTNPFFQCLVMVVAVVVVDQLSKYEAARYGLVSLNTGISFGLLGSNNQLVGMAILVGFTVLSILAIKHYCKQNPFATGLFIGGALANILDRFWFGAVRDWLPLIILPVKNNLADWAIFLAVVWLFVSEWRKKEPSLR